MRKITLMLLAICCVGTLAMAQTTDVVYLKNGSIIKANLIEHIIGKSVKIQTTDGSVFVYREDEVLKIEKAKVSTKATSDNAFPQTVTDIDGNVYRTVKIGQQVWLSENLRTTHYADGTPIMAGTNSDVDGPKYFFQSEEYIKQYGLLYNWAAALRVPHNGTSDIFGSTPRQGACPDGWHVPSVDEFQTLFGGKMDKESAARVINAFRAQQGWGDQGGSNSSGFSGLPAGVYTSGKFEYVGKKAYFWTSTKSTQQSLFFDMDKQAHYTTLQSTTREGRVSQPWMFYNKEFGNSVRCIKD